MAVFIKVEKLENVSGWVEKQSGNLLKAIKK